MVAWGVWGQLLFRIKWMCQLLSFCLSAPNLPFYGVTWCWSWNFASHVSALPAGTLLSSASCGGMCVCACAWRRVCLCVVVVCMCVVVCVGGGVLEGECKVEWGGALLAPTCLLPVPGSINWAMLLCPELVIPSHNNTCRASLFIFPQRH